MNNDFQEQDAIRYFLGELSETEQTAVEERFFIDEDFSVWLDAVETDLIDSYARRELNAAEHQKFEQNFLVSERRRLRVEAAVALWEKERSASFVPVAETAKPSFWESLRGFFAFPQLAYGALGILFLALIGGIALVWQRSNEIAGIKNENIKIEPTNKPSPGNSLVIAPTPTPYEVSTNVNSQKVDPKKTPSLGNQNDEPKKETPKEVKQNSPVLSQFSLTSSSMRSGSESTNPNSLRLKPETENVYLGLRFRSEEEFVKYRIELSDARGKIILSQNLKNKNALGITVSANKLQNSSYKITLKGAKSGQELELLDVFDFIVEKK